MKTDPDKNLRDKHPYTLMEKYGQKSVCLSGRFWQLGVCSVNLSAMKSTPQLFLSLLLLTVVPAVNSASAETTLSQQLARCTALSNDQARLACFDALARNVSTYAGPSHRLDLIQPPATFLDSQLVAEAWKTEYKLTVRSFVELISHAVLENKQHVTVQGWSRDKHEYVLHITLRTPVKLHFLPREAANDNSPMSLLREVTMDGYTISAEEFIDIIAAMDSDEKTGNTNALRLLDSQ